MTWCYVLLWLLCVLQKFFCKWKLGKYEIILELISLFTTCSDCGPDIDMTWPKMLNNAIKTVTVPRPVDLKRVGWLAHKSGIVQGCLFCYTRNTAINAWLGMSVLLCFWLLNFAIHIPLNSSGRNSSVENVGLNRLQRQFRNNELLHT